MRWTLKVGGALAAALAMSLSLAGCEAPASGAKPAVSAPDGQVAVAPEGQTMSPGALNRLLEGRGFTPTSVRRRGNSYVVDARGPSGNDVRMVVDGRAGEIRGLDVRRWAPGQRRISRGSRGNEFVNDTYEFGVTVEDELLAEWALYEEAALAEEAAWIEYEEIADWEWSQVEYEAAIEDYSYEAWEAEYGAIDEYEDSFYEDEAWGEYYGDEEVYFEDEAAYAEDLTADYGEAYYEGYEEEAYAEGYYEDELAYEEEVYDDGGGYYEEDAYADDGGYYDDGGEGY